MTVQAAHASDVSTSAGSGRGRPWAFALLVGALLLASGLGFRVVGGLGGPINLTPPRVPLTEFPSEFLGYVWTKDRVLDPDTERVLGAMAYVNRDGFRERDKSAVALWVSYYGQSQTLGEHEPEVCMIAGGWTLAEKPISAVIPMPATADKPAWDLEVNVYVFEKDVAHTLLVNTYCVNGEYRSDRSDIRAMGERGQGFYAQTRVVIPLNDYEWASIKLSGGVKGIFRQAQDVEWVTAGLEQLQQDALAGTPVRRDAYLRAAEIMRFVIPELDRFYPAAEAPSGAQAAP